MEESVELAVDVNVLDIDQLSARFLSAVGVERKAALSATPERRSFVPEKFPLVRGLWYAVEVRASNGRKKADADVASLRSLKIETFASSGIEVFRASDEVFWVSATDEGEGEVKFVSRLANVTVSRNLRVVEIPYLVYPSLVLLEGATQEVVVGGLSAVLSTEVQRNGGRVSVDVRDVASGVAVAVLEGSQRLVAFGSLKIRRVAVDALMAEISGMGDVRLIPQHQTLDVCDFTWRAVETKEVVGKSPMIRQVTRFPGQLKVVANCKGGVTLTDTIKVDQDMFKTRLLSTTVEHLHLPAGSVIRLPANFRIREDSEQLAANSLMKKEGRWKTGQPTRRGGEVVGVLNEEVSMLISVQEVGSVVFSEADIPESIAIGEKKVLHLKLYDANGNLLEWPESGNFELNIFPEKVSDKVFDVLIKGATVEIIGTSEGCASFGLAVNKSAESELVRLCVVWPIPGGIQEVRLVAGVGAVEVPDIPDFLALDKFSVSEGFRVSAAGRSLFVSAESGDEAAGYLSYGDVFRVQLTALRVEKVDLVFRELFEAHMPKEVDLQPVLLASDHRSFSPNLVGLMMKCVVQTPTPVHVKSGCTVMKAEKKEHAELVDGFFVAVTVTSAVTGKSVKRDSIFVKWHPEPARETAIMSEEEVWKFLEGVFRLVVTVLAGSLVALWTIRDRIFKRTKVPVEELKEEPTRRISKWFQSPTQEGGRPRLSTLKMLRPSIG
jgi:hypothetical protein